jgi:hypothetical protein
MSKRQCLSSHSKAQAGLMVDHAEAEEPSFARACCSDCICSPDGF